MAIPGRGDGVRRDAARPVRRQLGMGDGPTAMLSTPREANEVEVCARCHARRGQFSDVNPQAASFLDAFRPALIEPGLYHADGPQLDEVFKGGSFLQSRMHDAGVTCADCHDPHSGATLLEGNALCGQCHEPTTFDSPEHHFHKEGTEGALCTACHMPPTDYMIVDARHDHSFRIPRPELTVEFGIPNACTGCHVQRDAEWALRHLDERHPGRGPGFQDFAGAFAAFDRGLPGAREEIVAYLEATERPAIVTASALRRLAGQPSLEALAVAVEHLTSPEPLERAAATEMVALAAPAARLDLLAPLLTDQSRLVRMDAARTLAGPIEETMDAATRASFEAALAEYIAAQMYDAERPEANANLAALHLDRGDLEAARRAFEDALVRDPTFVPAIIGLAQVIGATDGAAAAERLRAATRSQPELGGTRPCARPRTRARRRPRGSARLAGPGGRTCPGRATVRLCPCRRAARDGTQVAGDRAA